MAHYYEILQVRRDASRVEIKTSFRKLAKKYHPDFHPERGEWAHGRMRDLLRAYEVLIDDEKRAIYNRTLSHLDDLKGPTLRESLRKKRNDPGACCRLIFLDLLEGRGGEGVSLYEELLARDPAFSLKAHMKIGDYLDCVFLIAEEYERGGGAETAFDLYRLLYREDRRYNYFKHFRDEILLRIRNLVVQFLRSETQFRAALLAFSEIMETGLPRRERAFLYKKAAERLCREGLRRMARLNMLNALLLNPKLGGTKKIRRKLALDRKLIV